MIMADVLKIFLLIVGLLTVYVSYWLVSQALFPALVERARHHYSRPVRITIIGLLVALLPFIAGAIISKHSNPALKLIGVTLMVVPALLGLVGSTGLTLRIGYGLPSPTDDQQPWRRVMRGGIVLALTFLLPIVGWFILPIWALVSGLGAFVLSFRAGRRSEETPPQITADMSPA